KTLNPQSFRFEHSSPLEHHTAGRGVYGLSVGAELVGPAPQTLLLYERKGWLAPDRPPGATRRYSPDDLDRLRHISQLLADGLNLAGIAVVLQLEADNARLRADLTDTQS